MIKMSFVDLATLTLHRQHELEARINTFIAKGDQAINNIKKLQVQARSFVQQLNCEPSELKDRFLSCMNQLDEYTYLVTDINLAIGKLEETHVEYTPVHDTVKCSTAIANPPNLIDVLSETAPSTTTACQNLCPSAQTKRTKPPKNDQCLIQFSSTSCSSESVPVTKNEDKEIQCEGTNISSLTITIDDGNESPAPGPCYLPAQTVLQTDQMYSATIMSVDGFSFWVITEHPTELFEFMMEMTNFYRNNDTAVNPDDLSSVHYCAVYDVESDCYYRALFIKMIEDVAELFFVDTGEIRTATINHLRPLAQKFCEIPPYARCCHLAGIDLDIDVKDIQIKQVEFMKQQMGLQCHIEVDDNTSESLGVYVIMSEKGSLNDLMVEKGLAVAIDKPVIKSELSEFKSEGMTNSELDILQCPEYEDPVEAVTGYHNRDEADICKHYKGGPEKTCFKGNRCKKKHVVKHPDGWTLDRVEAFVYKTLPLPAPDTWYKVTVTYVCHFNRVYVQYESNKDKEEPLRDFGVVLPPTTLAGLVRDMNSPASRIAYKPLKLAPAEGELVAALYPMDGQWYRAQVVTLTRADQNVEVMYVDYGNLVWVKENDIRQLEPRWVALPAQAQRARLAGVVAREQNSRQWAQAKQALATLVHQRTLHMHVVGREYDEVTVELFDEDDRNIAEQFAAMNMVKLEEYSVSDDSHITHKQIVP